MGGALMGALTQDKIDRAVRIVRESTASGELTAAVLSVRQGDFKFSQAFGAADSPDTVFLIASISKPMTAAGVMRLADAGELALSDPVRKFIPEFQGGDRDLVTVRHLLTHTSGLPDMLPENIELRRRHAPLKDFVAATCRTPLLFKPGTRASYQSMGILLAAEIGERITKQPFRNLLKETIFGPLRMHSSSLGLGGRRIPETAQCQVSEDNDWNWNTPYWRDLGAPWGGVHSTAPDVIRFVESFLFPDGRVLKTETARSMISNQNAGLNEAFGLGWMVKPGAFGKGCSSQTFGHFGATGTVAWGDPANGLRMTLLTTKPVEQSRQGLLGPVSDAISEAL